MKQLELNLQLGCIQASRRDPIAADFSTPTSSLLSPTISSRGQKRERVGANRCSPKSKPMILPRRFVSRYSFLPREESARSSLSSAPVSGRGFGRRLLVGIASLAIFSSLHAAELVVVASGLKNPRGLDFAPNGALYIAEAGIGGSGPKLDGPEGPVFFGLSGSVTRVWKGQQVRIVDGLPSLARLGGGGAGGPTGISFGELGNAVLTIGLGANPNVRADLGSEGALMGTALQLRPNGSLKLSADLAGFEGENDPDAQGPDSNPTGVLNEAGGTYFTDAGANALLYVAANGHISVVAVFPNRVVPSPFGGTMSMQSVPTNVVRGPDGALYVSELTGFPFPKGAANVYRVVPGSTPTVFASGFTNIIDLEFDAAGNLYVLEVSTNGLRTQGPGRLARVKQGGAIETIVSAGLVMPGGMAIGPDGLVYITNFGVFPNEGQVVKVQP